MECLNAYPKTKAQQLLDSFYWYYSSEELAVGISQFYKENCDTSNTMKKYIDICWTAGTPFIRIKFQPHNLLNMLDYQTLITLRHFIHKMISHLNPSIASFIFINYK